VGASEKERFIPASDRGKVDIGLASFLSTLDHSVTLAHPQFLKKSPLKIRSLIGGGISWGSGRRNLDHHPEAVVLPWDRACPGGIETE